MSKTRHDSEIILATMMTDKEYFRKWSPLIEPRYFDVYTDLYTELVSYVGKYDRCPTPEELLIEAGCRYQSDERKEAFDALAFNCQQIAGEAVNRDWLEDRTKAFIEYQWQQNAIYDIILDSEKGKDISQHVTRLQSSPFVEVATPGLDSHSPDFAKTLFAHLTRDDARIPFDIEWLNKTVRGVKRQTLNVILAPTNHGKSLMLCHLSAMYMRQGLNVLYITLEMDETTTAVRVHANVFDTAIDAMERWSFDEFQARNESLRSVGRFVVRGYPTGGAHAGHFRSYIEDLKKTLNFTPDVICVDYLNICASERMSGGQVGMYQYIGAISKELRALAQSTNTVVWTATQTNRSGLDGDVKLSNTSDSMQTAFDADLIINMWRDDLLSNKAHLRIGKDRNGAGAGKHGIVGIDTARMKLTNLSEAELSEVQAQMQKIGKKSKKADDPDVVFAIDK